uniref:type I-F CRISPR-associated helicase Cas3f n=1 Tax=Scandinavium goeteborgense TaxID=1851514 RepID=UPI00135884CD|nr:type I-F CRISPR-associated helicase Cas3f [Scandinavium goeteborgense]
MNILLVSQCTKKAREQSCRIIDQFAERLGDSCWQTAITLEGVTTLRKLLRKTARRNTAVACHWIKKSGQSELLWIVGNQRRFNIQGRVPTHRTSRSVDVNDNLRWQSAESIALLAALAGLFHDFGKAGACFQKTLQGKTKKRYQPYRHEWISVRLFQAFVGEQTDAEWLASLGTLSSQDDTALLARLKKDSAEFYGSPFATLPPLATTVAWLIVSHHRLPRNLQSDSKQMTLKHSADWLRQQLNADWNALNHEDKEWTARDLSDVWRFPAGTPLQSATWREKARQIARRAASAGSLSLYGTMDNPFTLHLARFCLMLADHFYSSGEPQSKWQDPQYRIWANSDRDTGALKQRVDEHLSGVAHHALLLGRQLMHTRASLPSIGRHKGFRERATVDRYLWQNKAWDLAVALREQSRESGFFGVNMSSTGCGKTFANARIMYALADEQEGCRFTVALGLRTLTLQTGDALRERLRLAQDDLAVLTGSAAVRTLWQQTQKEGTSENKNDQGSASAEHFAEEQLYVHYEGSAQAGVLQKWLEGDSKLATLVSAPVLVSTIDHLIPATEGVRGGQQLPGMLRLLTSDLVLDEPDDFDISDLHAVCRLMNWAGMLGTRVLLSSATLPPELVQALFAAYLAGRRAWHSACGLAERPVSVCCAWFDEYHAQAEQTGEGKAFRQLHEAFAQKRAEKLGKKERLQFGRIAPLSSPSPSVPDVVDAVAGTLHTEMLSLHEAHKETHRRGKSVSLGLVRFANTKPLVAVARALMAIPSPQDVRIHYCVYHGKHPLLVRSAIEKCLDNAFNRHQPETLWQVPEIKTALESEPEKQHLFVVLGTSVLEVGRDWDASWGIIEPSSMRSIIQFAGRIQRHRRSMPKRENLVILSHNVRGLRQQSPAFFRPGFETEEHALASHSLAELLTPQDYENITSIPRISPLASPKNQLAALEHLRMKEDLMSGEDKKPVAADFWRKGLSWNAHMQHLTPFRKSQPETIFFLHMPDQDAEPRFAFHATDGSVKETERIRKQELVSAPGVSVWGCVDPQAVLLEQAEQRGMEIEKVGPIFGEVRLTDNVEGSETEDWFYHPWLGVYRDFHS